MTDEETNARLIKRGTASDEMIRLAKLAAQSIANETNGFVDVKILNKTIILTIYDEKV